MTTPWSNWARTETSSPSGQATPTDAEEVQQLVLTARERGQRIKPIGASHSFTGIGATDGVRVHTTGMTGLVDADLERQRVTIWAGTHLWELPGILEPLGLALPNMGDIDRQTFAGASQTGTHGTGLGFGGFGTMIVGMTLVTGTGEILTITEHDRHLLNAAAIGLGALGIAVTLTIQCVPRFILRAVEAPAQLEETLDGWMEAIEREDHVEFYWFPHTSTVRMKTNTRLAADEGREPLGRWARWLDEEFMNNDVLGFVLRAERLVPAVIPWMNRRIAALSSRRTYSDWSHRVFTTTRRVRFKETEFGVPVAAVPHAVREIQRMIERKRMRISFPIEVRCAAADETMLSTAYGRDTGYIAVHRFYREDEREYFREIQAIMREVEGRPHWGKMHTLEAQDLRELYPKFDEFLQVRERFDPDRLLSNPYLDRVLGP